MPRNLAEISPGETALVVAVHGDGAASIRLSELGLLPGTRLRVVQDTPLGGPRIIEVRGFRLSLRRSEASLVLVEGT